MMLSTVTSATVCTAALLVVSLASVNGAIDPVAQAIDTLRHGEPLARRQAADHLAQVGDQRAIDPLIQALRDADALVREHAEQALWRIWQRSGRPEVDALLQEGIDAMQRGDFQGAVALFTRVIEMAPDFAEGYNKRATVHYLMRSFEASIRDCDRTLALNPVHFGALSGTGLNYLELRNPVKALEYFERAVAINPNMLQIQAYIKAIKQFLRDQSL